MFILASFHESLEVFYYKTTMDSLTDSEFWFFIHRVSIFKIPIAHNWISM